MKCKGPNPEQAEKCRVQAEAYTLLSQFYKMSAKDQRVFMALFNALGEDDE
jgi:hypothetical protein